MIWTSKCQPSPGLNSEPSFTTVFKPSAMTTRPWLMYTTCISDFQNQNLFPLTATHLSFVPLGSSNQLAENGSQIAIRKV